MRITCLDYATPLTTPTTPRPVPKPLLRAPSTFVVITPRTKRCCADRGVSELYTVHCTVYTVRCTVYGVQCTVYGVRCTVYSVRCTVYSVRCTVYIDLQQQLLRYIARYRRVTISSLLHHEYVKITQYNNTSRPISTWTKNPHLSVSLFLRKNCFIL